MKRAAIGQYVCFSLIAFLVPPRVAAQNLKAFDYDQDAPLQLEIKSTENHDGSEVSDIAYESPRGGPVPAYLVSPAGKGPLAGIVFLHWGEGNRSEFLAEALLYAKVGAASVLIDAPFLRPEPWRKQWNDPAAYLQMVVDCRRAVDLLVSRPGVDPKRIGYVGHSLGATWGGAIAASERRFKALVLMAGFPALSEKLRELVPLDNMPPGPRKKQESYVSAIEPFDAERLIGGAAPAALLLQFARADRHVSQRDAQRFEQAASQPKQTRWYEGGHEFTDVRALPDRAVFFREHLGIKPLRPVLVKEIQRAK